MDKKCSKCGEIKPIEEFYLKKGAKDGHQAHCNICDSKLALAYRKDHHQSVLSKMKEWYVKHRQEKLDYHKNRYQEHRQERREYEKIYRKTERGKQTEKRYHEKNGYKDVARGAVQYAVYAGRLPNVSTLICSMCNQRQAQQYHHYKGYDKAHHLDVIALCIPCHGIADKK